MVRLDKHNSIKKKLIFIKLSIGLSGVINYHWVTRLFITITDTAEFNDQWMYPLLLSSANTDLLSFTKFIMSMTKFEAISESHVTFYIFFSNKGAKMSQQVKSFSGLNQHILKLPTANDNNNNNNNNNRKQTNVQFKCM